LNFICFVASGDECPPRLRKEGSSHQNYSSHLNNSTAPSPGNTSMSSVHEEYGDMSSPGWPRTPASPVRVFLG